MYESAKLIGTSLSEYSMQNGSILISSFGVIGKNRSEKMTQKMVLLNIPNFLTISTNTMNVIIKLCHRLIDFTKECTRYIRFSNICFHDLSAIFRLMYELHKFVVEVPQQIPQLEPYTVFLMLCCQKCFHLYVCFDQFYHFLSFIRIYRGRY